jgi:hypothetical protein
MTPEEIKKLNEELVARRWLKALPKKTSWPVPLPTTTSRLSPRPSHLAKYR